MNEMLPPERFTQVVTMYPTREGAEDLAELMVHQRLASASHVEGPIAARFWWDGGVRTVDEWRVTLKTTAARFAQIREQIQKHHPYILPEVMAWEAAGSQEYLAWIAAETETSGTPYGQDIDAVQAGEGELAGPGGASA